MKCEKVRPLLDDFVDGVLSESEHQELELHLAECQACAKEERALRAFLAEAAGLKRDRFPARDLWPEIADRIRNQRTLLRFPDLGRFRIALPALAAAAVVAIAFVTLRQGGVGPSPEPSRQPTGSLQQIAGSSELEQAEAEYVRATANLLKVFNARRSAMPPDEQKQFDENLATIDSALRDVRGALEKDPQNPKLTRLLASTHQKKLDLLLRLIKLTSQI